MALAYPMKVDIQLNNETETNSLCYVVSSIAIEHC